MARKLFSALVLSALTLASGVQAGSINVDGMNRRALTANNSDPTDWRVTAGKTFQGNAFDGVARLLFETSKGDTYVCSGSLLAGGMYVLTAAHCADDFVQMRLDFGVKNDVAKETRWAAGAKVHEAWTGQLGLGTDIALVRLNQQVTTIEGFQLSQSNDLGKDFLIMGYGTTGQGNDPDTDTNWNDWGWMHWGTNTADVDNNRFNNAIWGTPASPYLEYVADYDDPIKGNFNTLQVLADLTGGNWSSGIGTGDSEALIAGGDSGGGDFVWDGTRWLLSGVHSWGIDVDGCAAIVDCNGSSWGDLSGSTAVFSHLAWIQANTVPEPGSLALVLASLVGFSARRRKAA